MRTGSSLVAVAVVVWLFIGALASVQRGYFDRDDESASCATLGTTAAAIVAGPLNYFGMNPKLKCEAPQPSE